MIFLKKNISEKEKPPRSTLFRGVLACIAVAFAVSPLIADTRTDSIFVNGTPDSRITVSDSIRIAIKTPDTMRMEFYDKPNRSAATTKTPDLIKTRNNNFRLFWTDSAGISNSAARIFRRDFYVSDTGLMLSDTVNISGNLAGLPLGYLHADDGNGKNLVSLLDNTHILRAYYNNRKNYLDSIGGSSILYASQCRLKADTFLIVYPKGNIRLLAKKVYYTSDSTAMQDASEFLIDSNPTTHSFPTISTDSSGNFLAIWINVRRLCYAVYDSSFIRLDSGTLRESVDAINMVNRHDYAPSVSYARNKFVSANWEVGRLQLHAFTIIAPDVSIDSASVASGGIAYYPSIASNGGSIVVVWIEAQDSSNLFLKGLRYPITNNNLDLSAGESFINTKLANTLKASDTVVVNSEIDSTGNVGVIWHINRTGKAAMFVKRNMLFDSGSWTSPPIRLQQGLKDSICFDSFAVIGDAPLGTACHISFGVGADSTGMTDTIPAGSKSVLNGNSKGRYNFFQYRLSLNASPNELKTPSVRKVFYKWNRKPYLSAIKSVYLNNSVLQAKFRDTVTCLSRTDTVKCLYGIIDPDADTVYSAVALSGHTSSDSIIGVDSQTAMSVFLPLPGSDSIYPCRFSALDHSGWAAQDSFLYIKTRNSVPLLNAQAVRNCSSTDTTVVAAQSGINAQQTDSVEFIYRVTDTNDLDIMAYLRHNGIVVDSTGPNVRKHYMFHCTSGRPQGDQFSFSATDADTSVFRNILCGVNHFPAIDSITLSQKRIPDNDSVSMTLGSRVLLAVHATDADLAYWDTLHYSLRIANGIEFSQLDSMLAYTPSQSDSSVTLIVTDLFGARDSMMFYIKFPWYETDTVRNRDLWLARKSLVDSVSLIVGGKKPDTVYVPVKNTGKDTLLISSVRFNRDHGKWLRMMVPQAGGVVTYDSLLSNLPQVSPCLPDSVIILGAIFSADSLKGDGLVYDTIILGTNDAMNYFDTIPVRMEHNELPRMDSVKINFAKGTAYWLAKHGNRHAYTFPPHAKPVITFSEPMDSVSAIGAVRAYSIFDSMAVSGVMPIPLTYTWNARKTALSVSPVYSQASPYFHVMPQAGMFIPTDSIRLIISSAITDTAKTPHGPNNLDIQRICARAPLSDTSFAYRIDSINFDLVSVSPDSAVAKVSPDAAITLTFSSPPLSGTIDTSKNNNRCLVVYSSYHDSTPISFSHITQNNESVTFVPAKRFFYGDTVFCRYRSATIRDSLGYPIAINNDGIPVTLFDTSSSQGDKLWYFVIRDIPVMSFLPAANAVNVSGNGVITITFSDTLPKGVIDTSCIGNRSLVLTSRCSGSTPIGFSSVTVSRARAVFKPAVKLYYGDSVTCSFRGLFTMDTTAYFVDRVVFLNDKATWSFIVSGISMVSVQPESLTVSATIHPEIVMQFSDQVYGGTFDTDTTIANRSFILTSTFCKDTLLSFKSIRLSADNRSVRIMSNATFFSNDSVHCAFKGFLRNITYGNSSNLPEAASEVTGAFGWYFFLHNEGFYTYPNPYKPGIDPRHCANNGPCGICFKNLHTLKAGIHEISVKIFSIGTHAIYSTRDAGTRITFETGNTNLKPEWKWDTRNQHGELVASGLYLYAIYDDKDNVIKKGKLMIVR